ncbi:MAG TPA: cytochrome c biogenesis protein CcsA [Phycisphaerae bacterium]|nr:cytochrome c biogenesis protein CcsA [Phycisphaerae bacterium]
MNQLATLLILVTTSAVFAQTSQPAASAQAMPSAATVTAVDPAFINALDLEQFRLIAVQHRGRLKTFDTLAREVVQEIAGKAFLPSPQTGDKKAVLDPVYVFLDLMFRPEKYNGQRLYYVKKRPVRIALAQAASGTVALEVLQASVEDGRFSLEVLGSPAVRTKLNELHADVRRTAKDVEALQSAVMLARPSTLKRLARIVPPGGSLNVHETWYDAGTLEVLASHGAMSLAQSASMLNLPGESGTIIIGAWQKLAEGWRAGDAAAVNAALTRLAIELPLVAPAVYPVRSKLALEHWYYKYDKMTWVWIFYLGAVVFLLMGIVYGWRWARRAGLGFFTLAFVLHTVASGIRWYLAGRIPNSNMFEAVTAAAWFGAAVALVLEAGPAMARSKLVWWLSGLATAGGLLAFLIAVPVQGVAYDDWQAWGAIPTAGLIVHTAGAVLLISLVVSRRRGSGAGLTLLGASVAGMVAMMCGAFLSVELNSDIGTRMPVLNDLWLYIHTNMIIASYALIGIAFVTAAMYLVGRMLTAPSSAVYWTVVLPALLIPLAMAIPGVSLGIILPAWAPFLIVVIAVLVGMFVRGIGGAVLAHRTYAVWQGTPGVLTFAPAIAGPSERAALKPQASSLKPSPSDVSLATVLDGATMVLMELFFVMLWTGIIMGAIWADHSWGRPWGWDPKEVFALNTWIIFLILVHVRLRVRDKALWTAILVVVGTSVMLFNWIVVNFFITGLHSYA